MSVEILKPLRHRDFRLLFGGQVISDLGDWLSFLAIITLIVYRWNLGAAELAAFSIVQIIPWAFVAPLAGVLVDRWPRKMVMIVTDLIRAVVAFSLVFASDLPTLLVLVGISATVSTFFTPARQASIRSVVPDEDLLAANSLSQLSIQMGKVLGPAIGGVLVTIAGPQTAFIANGVTFLASAAFLAFLPTLRPHAAEPGEAGQRSSFWQEFRQGITFILRNRALATAVVGMAAVMFVIFTFDSLGALALEALGVDEQILGLAVGSLGLGTSLGAAVIGQWGKKVNPFAIMIVGVVVSGLLVASQGLAVMLNISGLGLLWLPVWFIMGVGGAAMFIPYGYILQVETPEELLGRVSAAAQGLQTVFQLMAPVVGAFLAEISGVGVVFALAGGALVLLGVFVLISRPTIKAAPTGGLPSAA